MTTDIIKSKTELKIVKNIGDRLREDERYSWNEIAIKSGARATFFRTGMNHRLLAEGCFVEDGSKNNDKNVIFVNWGLLAGIVDNYVESQKKEYEKLKCKRLFDPKLKLPGQSRFRGG